MQVPVMINTENGRFSASVVGVPHLLATAATREQALTQLRTLIVDCFSRRELVMLDVPEPDLMDLFGKYADDPTLQEICDEAYRLRDEERKALEQE